MNTPHAIPGIGLTALLASAWLATGRAGEPPLPAGLGEPAPAATAEPALPSGLGGTPAAETPPAPDEPEEETADALDFSGFWSLRAGGRLQDDPYQDQTSLAESRLQLRLEHSGETLRLRWVSDLVYDDLASEHRADLESGRGWLDLREANATLRLGDSLDLKAGRQVLTWGTGDLIFINDLFPKDYPSFFLGREMDYLKAPSDALKASWFSDAANLDLVYTPRFDPNRYVDGSRVSFYNPALGRRSGQDAVVEVQHPNNGELALRLYTQWAGYELAAYGYSGHWKNPVGMDPTTGRATFPALRVLGLSALGPAGPGLANLEVGYYDSLDDHGGSDPLVPNSEFRLLLGYRQELVRELNLGLQYYLEHLLDYDAYRRSLAPDAPERKQDRHWLTLRLTQLLMNQDLRLSLFTFLSPSDDDGYLRANVRYRLDDAWILDAGWNHFFGRREHTFFGRFERNSNLYLGVRYGFTGD